MGCPESRLGTAATSKDAPVTAIERQHQKNRMTVWERITLLVDEEPTILFVGPT